MIRPTDSTNVPLVYAITCQNEDDNSLDSHNVPSKCSLIYIDIRSTTLLLAKVLPLLALTVDLLASPAMAS